MTTRPTAKQTFDGKAEMNWLSGNSGTSEQGGSLFGRLPLQVTLFVRSRLANQLLAESERHLVVVCGIRNSRKLVGALIWMHFINLESE